MCKTDFIYIEGTESNDATGSGGGAVLVPDSIQTLSFTFFLMLLLSSTI